MFRQAQVQPAVTALASVLSLGFSVLVHGEASNFLRATQVADSGGSVEQIADTQVFPAFEGNRGQPGPLSLAGPAAAAAARSIRVLVKLDESSRTNPHPQRAKSLLALSGEGAGISMSLSRYAVAVSFGKTASGAAADTDLRILKQDIPRNVHYLLFSVYLPPGLDDPLPGGGDMFVTANEASIRGTHVFVGREIADPMSPMSTAGLGALAKGDITVSSERGGPGLLPLVEQRIVPLAEQPTAGHRSKHCFEDFVQGLTSLSAWWWERLLGAPSLCSMQVHDPAPAPQIDLVQVSDLPGDPDLVVYEADEVGDGKTNDFDVAAGILFCNDRSRRERRDRGSEWPGDSVSESTAAQTCTLEDREALAAIGSLSPHAIQSLLREMNQLRLDEAAGAAAAPRLSATGDARLDAWLHADAERAANALSASEQVNQVSDSGSKPDRPSNLGQLKQKVVKATCADGDAINEALEQAAECVRKAKSRLRRLEDAIALPPRLQSGGRYYLSGNARDAVGFQALVRSLLRQRAEMPAGIHPDHFERLTAAIAHDGAATGDNLGIVYLSDAMAGRGQRFSYGLNHIWAAGSGGGDSGHRDEWRALSVDTPQRLTQVLMSALTDVGATYRQTRTADGKVVRSYRRFTFIDRGHPVVFRNIRIVLRQNGMIVTAFPLKGAERAVFKTTARAP